ncbi:MAG: hypothetical protein ACI9OJ_001863 [Myxococcota bacterium]
MHSLKALAMSVLLMSTTLGCADVSAVSMAVASSRAQSPVADVLMVIFRYPFMDPESRWCHLSYALAGRPAQLGDGLCESLE